MRTIVEPIFHIVYLITIMTLGFKILTNSNGDKYFRLFGFLAIILGFGDLFHLIPRVVFLLTTGLEGHTLVLGIGKLITSITMTIFYLILYKIWKLRFNITYSKPLDILMYSLVAIRILICLLPQNQWFTNTFSTNWSIFRNIPFVTIGVIMLYLLYSYGVKYKAKNYKQIGICVFLSFAFYFPVVLFASEKPLLGMLMIPKTLAYVWIVFIGYKELKKSM